MIKRYFLSIIILLAGISGISQAQDTIYVQTLTFDSIMTRRGVWDFPDNSEKFQRILMYYTLKCDPRTTQDKYPCGEWDYLTYNLVFKPTGRMDSTALQHPLYTLGVQAPDTIKYSQDPTYTIYRKYNYEIKYDKVLSENQFIYGTEAASFAGNKNVHRIQFLLLADSLKSIGMQKGMINKLKLYLKSGLNVGINNLIIKMKNTFTKDMEGFDNSLMETVFNGPYMFTEQGWNDINLIYPFNWSGRSIIVEISYDKGGTEDLILAATTHPESFYATGTNTYLKFDGVNDYLDCGDTPFLNAVNKFTFEGWVNVHKWEAWNSIFEKGGRTLLQTGSDGGQLYCIVRNPNNTWGRASGALSLDTWVHVAMVFDGSQATNAERLKLFINGNRMNLTFQGDIPTYTELVPQNLKIGGSLDADLDEIRFWSVPLSDAEIAGWMNKRLDETHPSFANLAAYYSMDTHDDYNAFDAFAREYDAKLLGIPQWLNTESDMAFLNAGQGTSIPWMTFVQGTYESHLDSGSVESKVKNPAISIIKYKIEDHLPVYDNIVYGWAEGWNYAYGPNGEKLDSLYNESDVTVVNDTLFYHTKPYEIKDRYEIGRFITPYGIGLDLGPEGFTWMYDVTDYEPLLHGKVEFEAGNQQELIDVKFAFVKGTPPRDVLKIDRIWGGLGDYSYASLSEDKRLSAKTLPLLPEAKYFKVKTRITGHGHQSNDGKYPHCCEWKDNTHYLFTDGNEAANWKIFLYNECAMNPVYPQGGTWPGSREGWCPGDVVRDYDWEITSLIESDSVTLDYDITKVPVNNAGMGNGNYVMNMDLIHYSEFNNNIDAEITDVFAPNNSDYYSRTNPICLEPIIVVRNNSREDLNKVKITYKVSGGKEETFNWKGTLKPGESETINLSIPDNSFWNGDDTNIFYATLSNPNDKTDDYPANDTFVSPFRKPDLYSKQCIVQLQTNNRAGDFTFSIMDGAGNNLIYRDFLDNSTLYSDTLEFTPGCYTLQLLDENNLGLSYWAYPDQGAGWMQILDIDGKPLKVFDPDCGRGIFYSFSLGTATSVTDPEFDNLLELHPNPAGDWLNIFVSYDLGQSTIEIYNLEGRLMMKRNIEVVSGLNSSLDISSFSPGSYIVRLKNDKFSLMQPFVKE